MKQTESIKTIIIN